MMIFLEITKSAVSKKKTLLVNPNKKLLHASAPRDISGMPWLFLMVLSSFGLKFELRERPLTVANRSTVPAPGADCTVSHRNEMGSLNCRRLRTCTMGIVIHTMVMMVRTMITMSAPSKGTRCRHL